MTVLNQEPPARPATTLSRFAADFTASQATVGIVGFLFAVTGPTAILLAVGVKAGMAQAELASWLFGCFFLNGLISLPVSLFYRQPLVFLWSIPGIVVVGPALEHLSFPEVLGAYYATGAVMVVLGLTGWVRRCMEAVPMPIVMGMVAGVFLQFGLDWVRALGTDPGIAVPMTLAFLAATALPAVGRRCPPLIIAILVGAVCVAVLGNGPTAEQMPLAIAAPNFTAPVFTWQGMLELVVPLLITVVVVHNSQGFAVLSAAGHKPPMNAITSVCGVGSLIVATVGTVPTCLTGPLSGIIAGGNPDTRGHYTAAAVACVGVMAFGLFAPFFTALMLATPKAFIATLAGIALLGVLKGAFTTAFQGDFAMGALVAFMVTVSDLALFNIGAPFWGLVFGFAASWVLERGAFGRP